MIVESGDGWSALLLPLLILVGIGVLGIVGWLVWIFTRGNRSNEATTKAAVAPPPSNSQGQARGEPAPSVSSAALNYFLGLRRSTETGEWEIHVQGQPYASLEEVPAQQIRAQVISALRALVEFSRDYMRTQKASPEAPPRSPAPRRPQPEPVVGPQPNPVSIPDQARETPRRGSGSASMLPTIDFAQEIGDIVEEMLVEEPSLEGHAVRLMNAPTGGVNFIVDGVIYKDLSDIPNQDIQLLIRRATREWERR
jgi:hypothetical protein